MDNRRVIPLGKVYFDSKHPAGFGSVTKLVNATKHSRKNVKKWLSSQDTYTLHKPVRKHFPRNPYTVTNIDDVWEMDLAYLTSLSKYNDGYKFLLNVIDVFSRYAWSVPLKYKTGASVTTALKALFINRQPRTLQSDEGTEFVNRTVQRYLKNQVIEFHTTHIPDIKCALIETFNRTLKSKIYKYFTKHITYRYINILQKLLEGYNNTVHSTIGIAPCKVNPSNIYAVWQRIRRQNAVIPRGGV
jgi:transposase InsO family protein